MAGGGARRVGFFGGSFDPPHLGHLAVARAARDALQLDAVLFAPVGVQPLKREGSSASFEDRLRMTEAAILGEAGFEVSLLGRSTRLSSRENFWFGARSITVCVPHQGMIVTTVDTAYSTQSWADYTVVVAAIVHGGRFYIINMVRGRFNEYELPAVIANVGYEWKPKQIVIEEVMGTGFVNAKSGTRWRS